MCHLAALRLTANDIMDESKAMPDGFDELELNFQKDMLEQSFDAECEFVDQCNGQRPRLSCFTSVATEVCPVTKNESTSTSFGSPSSETDSASDKVNDLSVGEPNKSMAFDIDAMLNDSFEACV